ncbi:MAG TPA: type II methionyl aminopeptidase [Candidatus Nanoarchaeia archaeon]|nr:type II methionyl aminopeptidase [Candidatus Nanoarchaeia archaeon]
MEDLDKWKKAGRLAAEVLEYGKGLVKPGKTVVEITEAIEKKIEELGGKPAFPPQLSMNAAAAHECADPDDNVVLSDQLVKVDLGVQIDGCMSDNAATVDLSGKYKDLIDATKEALELAIKEIKPGVEVGQIGKVIGEVIRLRGYEPIRNLSGHGLGKFEVHAPPSIPNYDNGEKTKLQKGMIIAVEPFATPGDGLIAERGTPRVFMQVDKKPIRDPFSREILPFIESTYTGLPFSRRWLLQKFPKAKVDFALRQLTSAGILEAYRPLVEVSNNVVAQAEHTVLVEDEAVVLTKL